MMKNKNWSFCSRKSPKYKFRLNIVVSYSDADSKTSSYGDVCDHMDVALKLLTNRGDHDEQQKQDGDVAEAVLRGGHSTH